MNDAYPKLVAPATLCGRVLAIAPHPDDEVLACGGTLASLAEAGAEVRVLILTDGAAGKEGEARAQHAALRLAESRAAADLLGLAEVRSLDLADGGLGACHDLVERLTEELERLDPDLVFCPSPLEHHADHRAAAAACATALSRGRARRVLLYGVNQPVPATVRVDITTVFDDKRAALACFASQDPEGLLAEKVLAGNRAATLDIDLAQVVAVESFVDLSSERCLAWRRHALELAELLRHPERGTATPDPWAATAVISTWNKVDDVCANLDGLRAQTRPFTQIVVVDNASTDGTAERIAREYPEVHLVVMPHSRYGACETFNLGFATAATPLVAILDDDVVLPPEWLERTSARLEAEPETTAIVSTEVIEPGMPEAYLESEAMRSERYMSTFRGCASLARREALLAAGGYDERLFIYGNERDLTCRLLNLGYRVLQYPAVRAFHKTPFGIKMGKRSLFFHARNAWLTMLKYAPWSDLLRMPWLVLTRVLLRRSETEASGEVSDATGTIGIGRSVRETPGATWVLFKAGLSVLANTPYCLRHRAPVRAPDFELPLK